MPSPQGYNPHPVEEEVDAKPVTKKDVAEIEEAAYHAEVATSVEAAVNEKPQQEEEKVSNGEAFAMANAEANYETKAFEPPPLAEEPSGTTPDTPSEAVSPPLPAELPAANPTAPVEESQGPSPYAIMGASSDPKYLASLIPTRRTGIDSDFGGSIIMIYGPPKIGKSDLASQFPESWFLTPEEGHKHLNIYKSPITSWQHYLDTVQAALTYRAQLPYKTVVIDTVDLLLDFCMVHVCQAKGIDHPADEEWGKGWDALKKEWQGGIFALMKMGFTVIFISHHAERKQKVRGIERDVIRPTLGKTGQRIVMPSVDYIMYIDFCDENHEGCDGRKLVLRSNGAVEAGDRSGAFPPEIHAITYDAVMKEYERCVVPVLTARAKGEPRPRLWWEPDPSAPVVIPTTPEWGG